tara:strand:+ start:294 stop:1070 length:777 start_codon:yes stop_codon:yes gene_type:complete
MGKYFNVTVKPPIDVAALAGGNITDAEVLFDWHGFDIPKGAARLIGITALYTGKNGVRYAPTDYELFWAKSNADGTNPITLGDDGAAVDTFGWFNNIIGKTYVDASEQNNDADLITGSIQSPNANGGKSNQAGETNRDSSQSALVLQGAPDSGTNVGFDKIYVAAIAKGTHNWGASTVVSDGTQSTSSPIITVKTVSAIITCGPGDVLRDENGLLFGTVKTVDSATKITLEANSASATTDENLVYNTTPITLILSFEK